ncbi:hypothetical protein ACFP9V_26140 [Deinococcus radiopugnans]|uniref:DUF998 domain-containing protein n=1 Tax=Deinococcus radiopugnans ATCC 19172 TaxID=585398 RepID=A0A5C4XXC5_9DEIO|nr:hypothetical protein [Deinococcus radiopugnans]MBB6018187.1 hypothetical protein [Deinococcus radiopugnans ATCC 19172]TNM68157.1 hypothetical protein FHR04_16990 [Deinococcus radiopugnans ATCC 19172]
MNATTLRTLGLVTLLTAPAMTIEAARHGFQKVANENTDPIGALLYGLFSVGWLCGVLGLRWLRATGTGQAGRWLLNVLSVTVTLAILQSAMDLLRVPTGNALYMVTDLAWPLSMVLTLVVGVAAIVSRQLSGWRRFVPLFMGAFLPLMVIQQALGAEVPYLFDAHTILAWGLLGVTLITAGHPRPRQANAAPSF